MLYQGLVVSPWKELGQTAPPVWDSFWEKASKLQFFEHCYLLTTRGNLRPDEVMGMSTQERTRWVAWVLMDRDEEDRRYNNLVKTMIDLWTWK